MLPDAYCVNGVLYISLFRLFTYTEQSFWPGGVFFLLEKIFNLKNLLFQVCIISCALLLKRLRS